MRKTNVKKEGFEEAGDPSQEPGKPTEENKAEKPTEKNFQQQLEEYADNIVKSINYDRLKVWKEVFFHPTETLSDEIKNASLKTGARDVFVASLVQLLLGLVPLLIFLAYFGLIGATVSLAVSPLLSIGICGGSILLIVLYFALPIILWLFISAIQYPIAKLLGGKADFRTHAYLIALANASTAAASIPFALLGLIPCINYFGHAVTILIDFYALYLQYKVIMVAHNIDQKKAIATVLLPIIIIFVLLAVLFIVFYATYFLTSIAMWLAMVASMFARASTTQ